ncbi:MAG: hypothetical protein QGF59_23325 [Pirellulaceae bacterium]|jgi:hypothetical protein|nr:hypothetical protein [Pirellulaceae bacterium]
MSIHRFLLPLLATVVACTGCFHIRETIALREDGSGTAQIEVTFPQLGLRFLPGSPASDWLRPNLPDGVRLVSFENRKKKAKFTDTDGKVHDLVNEVYDVEISFDQVAALNDIRVHPDNRNATAAAGGGTPGKVRTAVMTANKGGGGPDIGPFQRLTLVDDGGLLRFRRIVQAARDLDEIEASAMNTPGSSAKPQVLDLNDASLVVTIACPGEVVEHNAHTAEDRTLTWNFSLKELQERQDRDWTIEFACRREGSR